MSNKKIVVYACGGTGINIGKQIDEIVKQESSDNVRYAEIQVYYIDTSESNNRLGNINEANTYLFEGIDGSGSDRTKNREVIADSASDILLQFPSGDLNFVINSTAGGSGSVIGPMICSRLLREGKLVIAGLVQVADTVKKLKNSVAVLQNYEAISQSRKKVLPVLLCNNDEEGENNVDQTIIKAVQTLAVLFSGELDRLDSADLEHWINYERITSHEIGAVLLDITSGEIQLDKGLTICSVATIAQSPSANYKFNQQIEYQAVGFLTQNTDPDFIKNSMHFVLIDGPIQRAYQLLEAKDAEANKIISSRKSRQSIVNKEADDDGMVY